MVLKNRFCTLNVIVWSPKTTHEQISITVHFTQEVESPEIVTMLVRRNFAHIQLLASFKIRDCVNISDECEIGGFQYHPIFHNQYGFDMENDIDGDPYTYIGPCGNGANCINHEIGWSCECIGRVTNDGLRGFYMVHIILWSMGPLYNFIKYHILNLPRFLHGNQMVLLRKHFFALLNMKQVKVT